MMENSKQQAITETKSQFFKTIKRGEIQQGESKENTINNIRNL